MNEKNIDFELVKLICQKRKTEIPFHQIIESFTDKLKEFDPINNCVNVEKYFGKGKGRATSLKMLCKDYIIKKKWLREYSTKIGNIKEDFKGLYVFINENTPFYVGISKGVIGRMQQHVKGHNHNTSTLAFKIGIFRYKIIHGKEFTGERSDFIFKDEVEPVKKFLLKQKVAFINIENDEELALFEIFCSMKLGTYLNSFETH